MSFFIKNHYLRIRCSFHFQLNLWKKFLNYSKKIKFAKFFHIFKKKKKKSLGKFCCKNLQRFLQMTTIHTNNIYLFYFIN
ncbi:hypothetical protein DR092_03815 [Mycoplasma hyorhinis]|nr:hypothetical protein [Mesomycoplasma hyorhinis]MXR39129.1 hypothetical protein [Mesomycoplasma hyorhinis]